MSGLDFSEAAKDVLKEDMAERAENVEVVSDGDLVVALDDEAESTEAPYRALALPGSVKFSLREGDVDVGSDDGERTVQFEITEPNIGYTSNSFGVSGGFTPDQEFFVFVDDDLRDEYRKLGEQVTGVINEDTLRTAQRTGVTAFVPEDRRYAEPGEIVVVARADHTLEALEIRYLIKKIRANVSSVVGESRATHPDSYAMMELLGCSYLRRLDSVDSDGVVFEHARREISDWGVVDERSDVVSTVSPILKQDKLTRRIDSSELPKEHSGGSAKATVFRLLVFMRQFYTKQVLDSTEASVSEREFPPRETDWGSSLLSDDEEQAATSQAEASGDDGVSTITADEYNPFDIGRDVTDRKYSFLSDGTPGLTATDRTGFGTDSSPATTAGFNVDLVNVDVSPENSDIQPGWADPSLDHTVDQIQSLNDRVADINRRLEANTTQTTPQHTPTTTADPPPNDLGRPWDPEAAQFTPPITDDDIPLHFPDGLAGTDDLATTIHTALQSGRHVVFTGPPGSGKTTLARAVCEHYAGADGYELATATSDWSTFDTVGGYRQRSDGDLQFRPGVFLQRWGAPDPDHAEAFDGDTGDTSDGVDEDGDAPPAGRNEWLIVDELNRAKADEAFGALFTVLTGDSVTLPFETRSDDPIRVIGDPDDYDAPSVDGDGRPAARRSDYVVPESWRLLATANSVDKATLYRLSYAFLRRFEFVHVPAPGRETLTEAESDEPDPEAVAPYLEQWTDDWEVGFDDFDAETVAACVEEGDRDWTLGDDGSGEPDDDAVTEALRSRVAADLAAIWVAASPAAGGGDDRAVGPGVIADLAEHALVRLGEVADGAGTGTLDYDRAVAGTLVPQFENRRRALERFLSDLDGVPGFENGVADTATAVLATEYLDADESQIDAAPEGDGT